MRPVCWNIITQIVKKYVRDTLIPTTCFIDNVLIKSLELKCHVHIFLLFIYIYIYMYFFNSSSIRNLRQKRIYFNALHFMHRAHFLIELEF